MVRSLALLLPVLMPSWRFFAIVAPSPRIEFALLRGPDDAPKVWQEFRPRPAKVPLREMLGRLIWNPHWNESLFITSCAERFLSEGSQTSLDQILSYLRSDLSRQARESQLDPQNVQIRFVVVTRDRDQIVREEVYRSEVLSIENLPAA